MPANAPTYASLFADHARRLGQVHLRELIADPARGARLRHRAGPLLLDLSRQRLDLPALDALGAQLEASGWQAAREAMFAGAPINRSEGRAVLHTALRAGGSALPSPAPAAIGQQIEAALERMARLVDAIHGGQQAALGLPDSITDIVNIGIGGSDLGPRLAVAALAPFHVPRVRSHFLTNVDGQAAYDLIGRLNPLTTLVVMVSKTLTTQETLLNGDVLRGWIAQAVGDEAAAVARHFLAVSANTEAAGNWGVPLEHVLPMWDFVGGRYSLWSAVGLSLALAIGMQGFRDVLAGGARMDDHFRSAPWQENLPALLALTEIWNRDVLGLPTRAVVPYADLLGDLPSYLQQLEMESLGKSVTLEGAPVGQPTVPVVWGSVGTNAQHAYFQALHQGTAVVPLDLIGVVNPAHPLQGNHDALLSNLLAQAAALALGKSFDEALAESPAGSDADRRALAAQRTFPGNRPSTVILLDALTPVSLGALIALYEHKVFLLGHLWGINAFDQWGVELGKSIARQILPALRGEASDVPPLDAATCALIGAIRERRS